MIETGGKTRRSPVNGNSTTAMIMTQETHMTAIKGRSTVTMVVLGDGVRNRVRPDRIGGQVQRFIKIGESLGRDQ